MISISFPSGPNTLRLEAGRGRCWCIADEAENLRVEVVAAGVCPPSLQPRPRSVLPLWGTEAGRIKPSTHDIAASKAVKQKQVHGAMVCFCEVKQQRVGCAWQPRVPENRNTHTHICSTLRFTSPRPLDLLLSALSLALTALYTTAHPPK